MKTIKLLLTLVMIFSITNNLLGQSTLVETPPPTPPNIIVVVSKSAACLICKENENRIMKEALRNIELSKIYVNDLTDSKTISQSEKNIKNPKIVDLLDKKSVGVIYFINLDKKKLVSTISFSKPTIDIIRAYEMALKDE
jgi:hypothetical protein